MKMAVVYCNNWSSGTLYVCGKYVYGYGWMCSLTAILIFFGVNLKYVHVLFFFVFFLASSDSCLSEVSR